jgi:hypothetical protein
MGGVTNLSSFSDPSQLLTFGPTSNPYYLMIFPVNTFRVVMGLFTLRFERREMSESGFEFMFMKNHSRGIAKRKEKGRKENGGEYCVSVNV